MTATQEERSRTLPEGRAAPPRTEEGRGAAAGGAGTTGLPPGQGLGPGKREEPLAGGRQGEDLVGRDVPNASHHKEFEITESF